MANLIDDLLVRNRQQHIPKLVAVANGPETPARHPSAQAVEHIERYVLLVDHSPWRLVEPLSCNLNEPVKVAVPELAGGLRVAGPQVMNPLRFGRFGRAGHCHYS